MQVSSSKMLDIYLGTPQSHLLIFTGIVIPEKHDGDSLATETVTINLNTPFKVTTLVGYTATVGLASIGNADSDFTFATDNVSVSLDQTNGQLQLITDIAVQGDSFLHRFSYQANIIVDVDEPLISGTISWNKQVATPNMPCNLFVVTAVITVSNGSGFGSTQVIAIGETTGAPVLNGDTYSVPYVILNVPLNTPVFVSVQPILANFTTNFTALSCTQVSGPSPVILTITHLKEANVNFKMYGQIIQ